MALMFYAGDVEAGQRAVAPFRTLATPLADLIRPMPYPEIYPPEDPDHHPPAVGHTMLVDQVYQVDQPMAERRPPAPLISSSGRVPRTAGILSHLLVSRQCFQPLVFDGPSAMAIATALSSATIGLSEI